MIELSRPLPTTQVIDATHLVPELVPDVPVIVGSNEGAGDARYSVWLAIFRMGMVKQIVLTFIIFDGEPTVEQVQQFASLNAEQEFMGRGMCEPVLIDTGMRFENKKRVERWFDENVIDNRPHVNIMQLGRLPDASPHSR